MKAFIRNFFQGLIIIVPIALTVFVIYEVIAIVTNLFARIGLMISPKIDPFMVIFAVIILIFLTGLLSSTLLFRPFIMIFDNLLERAPLIKTIYKAIKELLTAFVGSKRRFNKPVLVLMLKESNIEKLGFLTKEDLSELNIEGGKVAVYLPHSYNFSGNLYIVPKENVTPLDASAADVMKFIVTGGVTEIDES